MTPIRRYLRISRHSVLETRIYLEDPYSTSWLLNPQSDVLERIVAAIKPFVFRQLRDEKERAQGKTKKKKVLKDTAYSQDFEVGVYLLDGTTQHSLMIKQKGFGPRRSKMKSNSGKLTGWLDGSRDKPMELGDDDAVPIREESDDEGGLDNLPDAPKGKEPQVIDEDISDDEGFARTQAVRDEDEPEGDDKKKLAMNLSYDGFAIYGKVLCLTVKRRKGPQTTGQAAGGGRQMIESWVSTQAAQEPSFMAD